MHQPLVILAGPTASGKSELALDIAAEKEIVIINADSKQVYHEMPIITAQPSLDEQAQIEHRLYSIVSVAEPYSATKWAKDAKAVVEECWASHKLPVLVGGTGLYMQALVKGFSPIPDINPDIRAKIRQWCDSEGPEALHAWLVAQGDAMAERLQAGDRQRLCRAVEVLQSTRKSLAYWQEKPTIPVISDATSLTCFLAPPRQEVYERCNARFEKMVEAGALDEAKTILAMNLPDDLPAIKGHGLPELMAYLRGEMSLDDAIYQAQRNTRHYIKRQFTWFKHQVNDVVYLDAEESLQRRDKFLTEISRFLLTGNA